MDARWTAGLGGPGVGESIMNIGMGPGSQATQGIEQASATDQWAGFSNG